MELLILASVGILMRVHCYRLTANVRHVCFRHAYVEYGTEEEASEAAKKHRGAELAGQKLYVIKTMTVRAESFG